MEIGNSLEVVEAVTQEVLINRTFDLDPVSLTRFNKTAIQGIPQMAVDKEAIAYRVSTHNIVIIRCTLPLY